jgi:dipeptide/tripeptide permease
MTTQNKRLTGIISAVFLLLLIPFTAMQFTSEVNWSLSDFVIMGILLLSTGLAIEFLIRTVKTKPYRISIIVLVLLVFLLIWAELAVGIFGSPFAGS